MQEDMLHCHVIRIYDLEGDLRSTTTSVAGVVAMAISAVSARAFPVANGWDTDVVYVIRNNLYTDGANLNPQVPRNAIAIYNDPPLSVMEEQAYITRFGTVLVGDDGEGKSLTFANSQTAGANSPAGPRLFVAEPYPAAATHTDILIREFTSSAVEVRRAFVGATFGGGAGNLAGSLAFGSIRYNPKKKTLAVSATINASPRGRVYEFALPDWPAGSPATGTLTAVQVYHAPTGHTITDTGQPFHLDFDDEGWLYMTGKTFNANLTGDDFKNDVIRTQTTGLTGGGTTTVSITGGNASNLLIEGGVENQAADYDSVFTLAVRPADHTILLMTRTFSGAFDEPTLVYSLDPPRAANGNLLYVATLGPEGTNQNVTHAQRDYVNGAVLVGCYRGDGPGGGAKRINPNNSTTFMVGYRSWDMASPPADDWTPPGPVTNFLAKGGGLRVTLTWTNPTATDFKGAVIRMRTDGFPTAPSDGFAVADKPNTPGTGDSLLITSVSPGTTYYYAVFAYDQVRNYSSAAMGSAQPGIFTDFDADGDVDLADFAHLQVCFGGFAGPGSGCDDADLLTDTAVNVSDFNVFLPCLNGANQQPGC